jgi:leader peptidase (prepilin peptidase)/N-methyltransferase
MGLAQGIDALFGCVLGLLVGSFLNVVIHRLPRMLGRGWWEEVHQMLDDEDSHKEVLGHAPTPALVAQKHALRQNLDALGRLTLAGPASRCPHCGHQIRWYENIPVLSWLALRGRCSGCKQRISARYPIVEIVTAGFFALCAYRWGLSPQAAAWAAFAALLICLFLIDMDTFLLPDDLTLLLLWLGLLAAALGWTVALASAVWGAALGYLALWAVYHLFKLATGKEGMGYGDFKLLAALGAWLGAEYLLAVILLSSIVGAVIGILLLAAGKLANKDIPMPFGPYLAGAGLLALALGPAALPALIPFAFPFGVR